MPRSYFASFPVIQYANVVIRDITRRVVVADGITGDPRARAPLELRAGMRADTVATRYYGDAGSTWLVLLSAGVIDPAWGWYLDDDAFYALLESRFGSVEEAQRRVHHYATNWASDAETEITPDGWGVLAEGERKYWEPVLGATGSVVAYRRRRDDWLVSTNMIIDMEIGTPSGAFSPGERAQLLVSGAAVGNCQVSFANTTHVYAQHVAGDTTTVGSLLVGANSGASAALSSASTLLVNIPEGEQAYWEPVTEYDRLRDINESKKFVRLVDSRYADQAQSELKQKLAD